MSHNRSTAAAALTLAALLSVRASAATYSIITPGSNNNTAVGQNFSPSVGAAPNLGLAASDVVQLTSFAFTKGSGTSGNAVTRLVVLPGAYFDTNGADNATPTTIANVTAISTNTIDTTAAADGAALNFTFANPSLNYGSDYAVAFATVGAGNVLTFIPVSVKYIDYAETPPGSGSYQPTSNYGGSSNYNRTTLYADSDGDGYFQADNNAADLAFTATFQTVPEPASIAATAAGYLLARRRRSR